MKSLSLFNVLEIYPSFNQLQENLSAGRLGSKRSSAGTVVSAKNKVYVFKQIISTLFSASINYKTLS